MESVSIIELSESAINEHFVKKNKQGCVVNFVYTSNDKQIVAISTPITSFTIEQYCRTIDLTETAMNEFISAATENGYMTAFLNHQSIREKIIATALKQTYSV
jgi:hypothetical protein